MKNNTEYLGCDVAFDLPDWFPPKRADYDKVHLYGMGHAWEGSFDYSEDKNKALDALSKLPDVKEYAVHQVCGNWVTARFECEPKDLQKEIEKFQKRLNSFLARYKEGR